VIVKVIEKTPKYTSLYRSERKPAKKANQTILPEPQKDKKISKKLISKFIFDQG